ncbi:MAG: type VI secretion system baseplate subunit TssG [Neisseriaceae bacterium]|nr:type VI secretion system baseplate subunit TssG [Neisseriaceae bacterium]
MTAAATDTAVHIAELLNKVEQAPYRYDLYGLLRHLETLGMADGKIGTTQHRRQDLLRFKQEPELSFAPSAIHSAVAVNDRGKTEVVLRGFGLFGPNGPLPLHYSEYAYERKHHYDDKTLSAFADMFHHRLIGLFYRAWANAQSVTGLDNHDQWTFSRYVASLIGLGDEAFRDRDSVSDFAKYYYLPHLLVRPRTVGGLEKILGHYFQLPIQIIQNVGYWLPVAPEQKSYLNANREMCLGEGLLLGDKLYDRQSKFRVVIGPMDYAAYQSFMQHQPNARRLMDWVRFYCAYEYEWDVQLVLAQAACPAFVLGQAQSALGLSTWLGQVDRDANDLILKYLN